MVDTGTIILAGVSFGVLALLLTLGLRCGAKTRPRQPADADADDAEASGERPGQGSRIGEVTIVLVAAFGLLLVLYTSFSRARQTSQQNACIGNLRQMDSAKEQWAMENGKEDHDAVTTRDVNAYIKGSMTPTCPGGGQYTYRVIGTNPTCNTVRPTSHRLP